MGIKRLLMIVNNAYKYDRNYCSPDSKERCIWAHVSFYQHAHCTLSDVFPVTNRISTTIPVSTFHFFAQILYQETGNSRRRSTRDTRDLEEMILEVSGNTSRSGVLTDLRGFTTYSIKVLAYTRIGDGMASHPPILRTTQESGKVCMLSAVCFPNTLVQIQIIVFGVFLAPSISLLH